jgi:hypothetical protein
VAFNYIPAGERKLKDAPEEEEIEEAGRKQEEWKYIQLDEFFDLKRKEK